MTTKELIDYVEGELKKGEQKSAIKARLLQNGWGSNDIEETFRIVDGKMVETENVSAPASMHIVSSSTSTSFWDFMHKKIYKNYKERFYDFLLGFLGIIACWFFIVFPTTSQLGTRPWSGIVSPIYYIISVILFLYFIFKRKYIAFGVISMYIIYGIVALSFYLIRYF